MSLCNDRLVRLLAARTAAERAGFGETAKLLQVITDRFLEDEAKVTWVIPTLNRTTSISRD